MIEDLHYVSFHRSVDTQERLHLVKEEHDFDHARCQFHIRRFCALRGIGRVVNHHITRGDVVITDIVNGVRAINRQGTGTALSRCR